MTERKTFLRVLYTINGSPQYILARSLSPVAVTIISREEDSRVTLLDGSRAPVLYASVSLKTCLDTICRSSPELAQDPTRDYSLYVLDPLESNSAPAPVNISNTHGDTSGLTSNAVTGQSRGIAVGLGLMSWGLLSSDRDSIYVTGTLMKQPTGQEALEVIFAVRGTPKTWDVLSSSSSQESVTTEMSKQADSVPPQWYPRSHESSFAYQTTSSTNLSRSVSTSDLTRATVASIQKRTKAKAKTQKVARHTNTPVTESDKLMNASTYIGPLRKKGRPKGTNAEARAAKTQGHNITPCEVAAKEVIILDSSDNENDASQASDDCPKNKTSSQQPRPPFTTAPLLRDQNQQTFVELHGKADKSEGALFDLLSVLSSSSFSAGSTVSNAALLATLTKIDSNQNHDTHENPENTALIAALKQLLAIYTKPTASPKITTPLSTMTPGATVRPHLQFSSSSHSEDIVILDKENVDPAASRRGLAKNSLDKFSDPLPFALNSSKERATQSLRLSGRTNEIGFSVSKETAGPAVRKRTLSDFMDEKESGRRNKGKERESNKRHDRCRDSSLQRSETFPADSLRHYPQVLAANLPRSGQPSNYYKRPSDPWTSPARGRPDNAENMQFPNVEGPESRPSRHLSPRNHQLVSASSPVRSKEVRKKYVVPEWARTNTATMPRLSEEARRAMEDVEARKREERNAARRRLPAKQCKMNLGDSSGKTDVEPPKPAEEPSRPQFVVAKKADLSQAPISASSDGPMIAFPVVSAARASSPPLLSAYTPQTPKTPKSRVQSVAGEDDGSLFTPITAGNCFGSATSRGSICGIPSFLTSPLGNRKRVRISPTKSASSITALHVWSSSSSPQSSTNSALSEALERNSNLGKESEEALDNLDCPPGSLPIASSDIDIDWSYSQSTGEGGDIDDDSGVQTVKQHWAGLPPSSPPAPSSPMLLPEGRIDDEDMDELPIATDSETDADMNVFDTEGPSPNAAGSPEAEASQRPMNLSDEDFTALFSMENNASNLFQLSSSTTLDLFEQFTNVNAQSDDILAVSAPAATDPDIQNMFQNGIGNLDFTEFWETFKPMVNENTQPSQEDNVDQSLAEFLWMEDTQVLHGEVDHVKLADEMHSLLSGYLV